jgi:hypothetical protein
MNGENNVQEKPRADNRESGEYEPERLALLHRTADPMQFGAHVAGNHSGVATSRDAASHGSPYDPCDAQRGLPRWRAARHRHGELRALPRARGQHDAGNRYLPAEHDRGAALDRGGGKDRRPAHGDRSRRRSVQCRETLGGAKALGRDDLGRIATGAKADLLVWDGESLFTSPVRDPVRNIVYSAQAEDLESVVIDGNWAMRDRKIPGFDPGVLAREVQRGAEAM